MNKKLLALIPVVSLVVSCGEIPTLSEGPRSDESLSTALNETNFINYIVQSNHQNDELGNYFTVATISPIDLSFKTKTKQLLFTTEHSSYYFDRVDSAYDVYYKDKLIANSTYIGNSYYGRYNRTDIIEGIPTIDDIFDYYHVFNITALDEADFTYNQNLNGWYRLNEEAFPLVLNNFFQYDNAYTINHFNVQVSDNKIRSIEYELVDSHDEKIKNELFYTYPLDYLQDEQFSLINAVEVTKIEQPPLLAFNVEDTTTSEEPLTSEDPVSSEEPLTTEDPVSSEIPQTSEPISEEPSSEESEIIYVDQIDFAIYDDAKLFGANRYTIESVQLYENYSYQSLVNTPIGEVTKGDSETVSVRTLTLDRRLVRGNRYLLRINLASSPDGGSSDYYDYSWIH